MAKNVFKTALDKLVEEKLTYIKGITLGNRWHADTAAALRSFFEANNIKMDVISVIYSQAQEQTVGIECLYTENETKQRLMLDHKGVKLTERHD